MTRQRLLSSNRVRAHRSSRSPALTEMLQAMGSQIQQRRKALGLSQSAVTGLAGLDRAYLSAIEHGKQNVTISALLRLATALNTNIQSLLPASIS
jgi:predicted transcriptional regulator